MISVKFKHLSTRFSRFWRRYKCHKGALVSSLFLIMLMFVGATATYLAPYDPNGISDNRLLPPSLSHLMGTDHLGRDILSRVMFALNYSFIVGFLAVLLSALIGILIGANAGYHGGVIDELLMRVTDTVLVIPTFFLVLLAASFLGSSLPNLVLLIGLTSWCSTARLVRGEFLSLKNRDFVEAARVIGGTDRRLMFKHILPNALPTIIVDTTLKISWTITMEASLSFIGLRDPSYISLGTMVNYSVQYTRIAWWMPTFPGLVIFILVLIFNFIGDGLNGAFNPREKRVEG